MSELDLDAIAARAAAATRGPWRVSERRPQFQGSEIIVGWISGPQYAVCGQWPVADAEFVAHARADVPALLAEVLRLRQERDKDLESRDALRAALEPFAEYATLVDVLPGIVRRIPDKWRIGHSAIDEATPPTLGDCRAARAALETHQ